MRKKKEKKEESAAVEEISVKKEETATDTTGSAVGVEAERESTHRISSAVAATGEGSEKKVIKKKRTLSKVAQQQKEAVGGGEESARAARKRVSATRRRKKAAETETIVVPEVSPQETAQVEEIKAGAAPTPPPVAEKVEEAVEGVLEEEAKKKEGAPVPTSTTAEEVLVQPSPAISPQQLLPEQQPLQAPASTTTAAAAATMVSVLPKIAINELTTVGMLAKKMNVPVAEVIKKFMELGLLVTINQRIDRDAAAIVANEFGYDIEFVPLYGDETLELEIKEGKRIPKLVPRAPVVTILGHVDHGKTTLLDTIQKTKIAEKEFGRITQHIGAYRVVTEKGSITFLDTPGHAAFTAMRARGARVADIAILVVAADDGVMPQTIEALHHAREAKVPIIVAVNKIDLPNANVEKVKHQLAELGLVPESWGGNTPFVEISAKKNIGIDTLLEIILLQAEMLELKADINLPARGIVIESRLDTRCGPVATVIVQHGILKVGDAFIAGLTYGKVRAMVDDKGNKLLEAYPSTPVEILGFTYTPQLGDKLIVVKDEREAKHISERRLELHKSDLLGRQRRHITLESLHERIEEGSIKELKIILKADVRGSLEALCDQINNIALSEEDLAKKVKIRIIHSGIGPIKKTDCLLADASDAVVIGFNVDIEPEAKRIAQETNIEIKTYNLIFQLLDDLKLSIKGLLKPKKVEKLVGKVEVRATFKIPDVGVVAGCYVVEGEVGRGDKVKILRDNSVIFEGAVSSLKRFKEDVRVVQQGYECGVGIRGFEDYKKGDIIAVYRIEEVL